MYQSFAKVSLIKVFLEMVHPAGACSANGFDILFQKVL
jgi:hypothetical protein